MSIVVTVVVIVVVVGEIDDDGNTMIGQIKRCPESPKDSSQFGCKECMRLAAMQTG
jgi:hypothetical protein